MFLARSQLKKKLASQRLVDAFGFVPEKKQKIGYGRVRTSIKSILNEAQRHWYKFVRDGKGVIDTAYRDATGERMPTWLYDQCKEILDKNIKLLDGIKEGDTLDWDGDFFVPGYKHISWTWWRFEMPREEGWQPIVGEKEVPLEKKLVGLKEALERYSKS